MKIFFWILGLPFIFAIVIFALSNRGKTNLGLWPLLDPIEIPLYAAVLTAAVIGFLAGGIYAWVSGGKLRRRVRGHRRQSKLLEKENQYLRKQLAAAEARRHVPLAPAETAAVAAPPPMVENQPRPRARPSTDISPD